MNVEAKRRIFGFLCMVGTFCTPTAAALPSLTLHGDNANLIFEGDKSEM